MRTRERRVDDDNDDNDEKDEEDEERPASRAVFRRPRILYR